MLLEDKAQVSASPAASTVGGLDETTMAAAARSGPRALSMIHCSQNCSGYIVAEC